MPPDLVWANRVRRIHGLYKLLVVVGITATIFFTTYRALYATTGNYPGWTLPVCKFLFTLFLAMIWAQVISAKMIFLRCPLTILENYLRGYEDVKCYWVVRLPGRWTVILLAGVSPLVFIALFVLFLTVTPWP